MVLFLLGVPEGPRFLQGGVPRNTRWQVPNRPPEAGSTKDSGWAVYRFSQAPIPRLAAVDSIDSNNHLQ